MQRFFFSFLLFLPEPIIQSFVIIVTLNLWKTFAALLSLSGGSAWRRSRHFSRLPPVRLSVHASVSNLFVPASV